MHRLWPVCGGHATDVAWKGELMEPWVTPWSPVTDWFTFHPFPATDKNECLNSTACPLTATCNNTQGSYLCVCNPGFETPAGRAHFTGSRGTCIGKQILWRLPVKISSEKELRKTNNASVQIWLQYANNLSIPQYLNTVTWYSCLYMCITCVRVRQSLQLVQFFAIPWTVARQAALSMGFSRQEYCSGLPFPSPRDIPDPKIKPWSPTLQADSLQSEPPGKPKYVLN